MITKNNCFFANNNLLLISLIFLVSLLLRICYIDIPLNTDETLWISRGYAFVTAILNADWDKTYQVHHPGVINMWIIGISEYLNFWIVKILPENWTTFLQYPRECLLEIPAYCPINAYILPRLIQGIITSICMVGFYWFSEKIFTKTQAILATFLLIFSPFFLAYQRFITTDALQVNFSILAVLSFLFYLQQSQRLKFLLLSGFFFGLGILAKVPTLFFLPVIILILVLREFNLLSAKFPRLGWQKTFQNIGLFSLVLLLTLFILWPILIHNFFLVWKLLNQNLQNQVTTKGVYFLGETTESPNILFYPLVLIYRLSPVIQLGLIFFLISLIIVKPLRNKLPNRSSLFLISLFALIPFIFLSIVPSKVDRYAILIYPQVMLLTSAGWLTIFQLIIERKIQFNLPILKKSYCSVFLITICLIICLVQFPYQVAYHNPLFGGSKTAKNILMLGNGEGLDKVARWLNQQPNSPQFQVLSWYETVFSSYFKGKVIKTKDTKQDKNEQEEKPDFIVLYVNQIQRGYGKYLPKLKNVEPIYTVTIDGIDYAEVYQNTNLP